MHPPKRNRRGSPVCFRNVVVPLRCSADEADSIDPDAGAAMNTDRDLAIRAALRFLIIRQGIPRDPAVISWSPVNSGRSAELEWLGRNRPAKQPDFIDDSRPPFGSNGHADDSADSFALRTTQMLKPATRSAVPFAGVHGRCDALPLSERSETDRTNGINVVSHLQFEARKIFARSAGVYEFRTAMAAGWFKECLGPSRRGECE